MSSQASGQALSLGLRVLWFAVRGIQLWASGVAAGAGVACFNIALRLIVARDDYKAMSWGELRGEAIACLALSYLLIAVGAALYSLVRLCNATTGRQKWWKALLLGFILTVTIAGAGAFVGYFFEELNGSIVGGLLGVLSGWMTPLTLVVGVLLLLLAKIISPGFWTMAIDAIRRALDAYLHSSPPPPPSPGASSTTSSPGTPPPGGPGATSAVAGGTTLNP
ncbi:hypothetical protein ACWGJ9_11520 [Curtobacterium citreum]